MLDSGLEKFFGRSGFELLRGHLVNLVKAESEAEYDSTLHAAFFILQNLILRNGELEAKLSDFEKCKTSYAILSHRRDTWEQRTAWKCMQ